MDILDSKTEKDLLLSALAETAKARNEINSAEEDIKKIRSRLGFMIVLLNKMIDRLEK